jgi:ubiquinone/menaquinone biosynthesis C-methylase UbiE
LEVGCGTAATLAQIAFSFEVSIDGVDVLPEMLRVASTRLKALNLHQKVNLTLITPEISLPFSDQSYDRVYTESVLGFQDEKVSLQMLAEIFRVLKPGGLYVANEAIWKTGVSEEIVSKINQACIADFGLRQASERAWDIQAWSERIEQTGFKVLSRDFLVKPEHITNKASFSLKKSLSNAITGYYKIGSYLHPQTLAQRIKYRHLLKKHKADGQYIEARLLVLQKP